jgi:hypothetical protein
MSPDAMATLAAAMAQSRGDRDAAQRLSEAIERAFREARAKAPCDVRDVLVGRDPSHSLSAAFLLGQLAMARAMCFGDPAGADPSPGLDRAIPGMDWRLSESTLNEIALIEGNSAPARSRGGSLLID